MPLILTVACLVLLGVALQVLGQMFLASVGRKAVNRQPDQIHLALELASVGDEDGLCVQFANPLMREGFVDAGTFSISSCIMPMSCI